METRYTVSVKSEKNVVNGWQGKSDQGLASHNRTQSVVTILHKLGRLEGTGVWSVDQDSR